MTNIIETRQVSVFDNPLDALSFDVSRLAVYKEQVRVTYQYLDAGGTVLNPVPGTVAAGQQEIVDGTLLLSAVGAAQVYDNAPNAAVQVRLTFDSSLAPQPTEADLNASLSAEELQQELLKRDLQDEYVLQEGRADDSVDTSALVNNTVTEDKLVGGLRLSADLPELDITHEEDDSSVGLPYFGYISDLNVFRKASHDNLGRNGAEAAIGIARSRVGADVKVAVVDGAIVDGFSGLQAGRAYTLDNDGNPVQGSTNRVAVAVSATRLMLKGGS